MMIYEGGRVLPLLSSLNGTCWPVPRLIVQSLLALVAYSSIMDVLSPSTTNIHTAQGVFLRHLGIEGPALMVSIAISRNVAID